jgi:hypothetical protein
MIRVLFRTCDNVSAVNGGDSCRPLLLKKEEILRVAANSLSQCLKNADHEVYLIGDGLRDETVSFLTGVFETENVFNSQTRLGSGGSLLAASNMVSDFNEDDIVFFAEDDYLFIPEVFSTRLLDFIKFANSEIKTPWFIHPTDYPDQYTRSFNRSYIIQTNSGYWREVSSTTGTFLCRAKDYMLFKDYFDECYNSQDKDGNLSKIFGKNALCFSPIPSIGTHLHIGTMPNYIDWETQIKKFK